MVDRLTAAQFNTLQFIRDGGGKTFLLPMHWRDQHHQALLKRGLLSLRTDPFKTKANMLYGRITARGRKAVSFASAGVREKAKAASERSYAKYVSEIERGLHE